jgi:iron complex outermembrane recepter protein
VLRDFYVLDATARASWSRATLTLRGGNLGNTQKFGSGSVSGSGRVRYFVLPVRAVFATVDVAF